MQSWPCGLTYAVGQDSDDGTEANGVWHSGGYTAGLDRLGNDMGQTFIVGLRFALPDLEQVQTITYARLRLAAQGGAVTSNAHLVIRGANEDSPETFSDIHRPSMLPKTDTAVTWDIRSAWFAPGDNVGLRCSSPNLAAIVNEVLARPAWGRGPEGKTMVLTIEGCGCPEDETNFVMFEDYDCDAASRDVALLEVYVTLADAFVGKPILGRPTATSVTINVINLLGLDAYAEYGTTGDIYSYATAPVLDRPAGGPIEMVLNGLEPDTEYHYRVRYRECGDSVYLAAMDGEFRTQRADGTAYDFTIQADSHIWPLIYGGDSDGLRLYEQTIENIRLDRPDFHISMGDFAHVESYTDRDVASLEEAVERYLEQRKYLDKVLHSIPFYLVLGNHEGEQGWRAADPEDSVAFWGTLARKSVMVNPVPDGFYGGDGQITECCGHRAGYYSWEWGDALFVVLDPFWSTTTKPHSNGGREGSEDPWDWTLGLEQYNWLYDTLHNSTATWKFVFIHHLVGGVRSPYGMFMTPYGRGGIEAAKHAVDGRASYEWGGESASGMNVFGTKRPGWAHGPIHDLLVSEGVSVVFHGHDHVFVHQILDGIVYQACPQPTDADYGYGWYADAFYRLGEKCHNSGHLRVRVRPDYVQVDYVRSVLPEDEPLWENGQPVYNRQVSYSYSIGVAGVVPAGITPARPRIMGISPNPCMGETVISVYLPGEGPASLSIYDVKGRLVRGLFEGNLPCGIHEFPWDGGVWGAPVVPGLYFCRLEWGAHTDTEKVLLLKQPMGVQ
jgi:hypothetical protein